MADILSPSSPLFNSPAADSSAASLSSPGPSPSSYLSSRSAPLTSQPNQSLRNYAEISLGGDSNGMAKTVSRPLFTLGEDEYALTPARYGFEFGEMERNGFQSPSLKDEDGTLDSEDEDVEDRMSSSGEAGFVSAPATPSREMMADEKRRNLSQVLLEVGKRLTGDTGLPSSNDKGKARALSNGEDDCVEGQGGRSAVVPSSSNRKPRRRPSSTDGAGDDPVVVQPCPQSFLERHSSFAHVDPSLASPLPRPSLTLDIRSSSGSSSARHSFDNPMFTLPEASRSAPSLSLTSPFLEPSDGVGDNGPGGAALESAERKDCFWTLGEGGGGRMGSLVEKRRNHERSMSHNAAEDLKRAKSKEAIRLERRFRALLELHDTEVGYLRDLRVLVFVYLDTIERAPFLGREDKAMVRRNVDQVLELGERMGRRVQLACGSKVEAWRAEGPRRDEEEVDKVVERLAKAFVSESPIFTVYEEFCSRHTEASTIIRALELMPEWASVAQHMRSGASSTSLPASVAGALSDPELSKLQLQDYAIRPIQRIMQYPMLLVNLLKYTSSDRPGEVKAREKVSQALAAMKGVTDAVNEARLVREGELRTELIATRMELHSSYRAAFVSLLGQIQVVGSLHILYYGPTLDPNEAFKIKYNGIFLYQTHLVIVKVKRTTVYEPRHWFPIRYFDLVDVADGSSIMPHSFMLRYRQHCFEFGATCEQEKIFWMQRIRTAMDDIKLMREAHLEADVPINDDSIVSSITLEDSPSLVVPSPIDSRMYSAPNTAPNTAPASPQLDNAVLFEEPISTINDDDSPVTPTSMSYPAASNTPRVSQRLSRNVNTLLGRTPAVAQAAIDLKLTEVFSEPILALRDQAARDQAAEAEKTSRRRTLSGSVTKRPTLTASATGRLSERRSKRMTIMDISTAFASDGALDERPPVPAFPHPQLDPPPPPSRPASERLLRRATLGRQSKSSSDVPSVKREWRLSRASTTSGSRRHDTAAPAVVSQGNAERSGGEGGVERSGSSGSSTASSAGPITPQPALVAPDTVVVATPAVTGIPLTSTPPSLSDSILGALPFPRRKPSVKSAPVSQIDVCDPDETASILTQDSRTASGSWLPGLNLIRKLSRVRPRRDPSSSQSDVNSSPPVLPASLLTVPDIAGLYNDLNLSPPVIAIKSEPSVLIEASQQPISPSRAESSPALLRSKWPQVGRKKSLKAFLRMTPVLDCEPLPSLLKK